MLRAFVCAFHMQSFRGSVLTGCLNSTVNRHIRGGGTTGSEAFSRKTNLRRLYVHAYLLDVKARAKQFLSSEQNTFLELSKNNRVFTFFKIFLRNFNAVYFPTRSFREWANEFWGDKNFLKTDIFQGDDVSKEKYEKMFLCLQNTF